MPSTQDMTERHAAALAEFAELCLASARDLAARQIAVSDVTEAASLASSLHKVGRSLRQSLALEAKLRRDQANEAREIQVSSAETDRVRRADRKAQARAAIRRIVWTEAESPDHAERLIEFLESPLDDDAIAEAFGDEPLDVHIAWLRDRLGLSAPVEMRHQSSA